MMGDIRLTKDEMNKENIRYQKWLDSFKSSSITKSAFGIWAACAKNYKNEIEELKEIVNGLEVQNRQLAAMEEDAQNYALRLKRELEAYMSFTNRDVTAQVEEYISGKIDRGE